MKYRAEVDGLRAIAVIAVIFYHAEFLILGKNWVEGGFIGVDIFFVISGYLISRIIFFELIETNSFHYVFFYERRIRRILPVLLVVILLSIPFAWDIMLASAFEEFSKSIIAALIFISNFFFYFSTTEYGAETSLKIPFLHTWSLGIEEQFYIIFPIFAALIYKYVRKHTLPIIIFLLLISLQLSEFFYLRDPAFSFYMPITRVWELLVGTALAYHELKYGRLGRSAISQVAPVVGLYLIVYSIFYFDGNSRHPGLLTTIPVIGAALIIGFSSKNDLIGKFLSLKIFSGLGLISYSLYLWHFPIFAFYRSTDNSPENTEKLGWVLLTLILSILSYFIVEKPFRNRDLVSKKLLSFFLISATIGILFSLWAGNNYNQKVDPKSASMENYLNYDWQPWAKLRGSNGKVCYERKNNFCSFNKTGKKSVFLVGDSLFAALQYDLKQKLSANDINLTILTSGGCILLRQVSKLDLKGKIDPRCSKIYQEERYKVISSKPKSIVILGGLTPVYYNMNYFVNPPIASQPRTYDRFFNFNGFSGENNRSILSQNKLKIYKRNFGLNLKTSIESLLQKGHIVILIYPIPQPGGHLLQVLKNLLQTGDYDSFLGSIEKTKEKFKIPLNNFMNYSKDIFTVYDSIKHPNIKRVFPHKNICGQETCFTHGKKHPNFIDAVHQTPEISNKINNEILQEILRN